MALAELAPHEDEQFLSAHLLRLEEEHRRGHHLVPERLHEPRAPRARGAAARRQAAPAVPRSALTPLGDPPLQRRKRIQSRRRSLRGVFFFKQKTAYEMDG